MAGKIKKIVESELVGGEQPTDIYPVTSTKAVYDENNKNLDSIIREFNGSVDTLNISSSNINDNKQSRISLYNMEKCVSNPFISQINNFLLDLEIIWDNEPNETYALLSIKDKTSSGGGRSISFFDVDELGHYTDNFHTFTINFNSEKAGVQYILDMPISVNGNTGKISIVVDWDKWTIDKDAMGPCYHSDSIYHEHAGPIMYLRGIEKHKMENVLNGNKITYLTSHNNYGSITDRTDKSFVISTTVNEWSYTIPPFSPSGNNKVHIKFKLNCLTPELLELGADPIVTLWLSDGGRDYDVNKCVVLGSYKDKDIVNYSFDPSYYTVYKGWAEFGVWIAISAGTSGGTARWQVTDFEVYELEDSVNGLEGDNLKEVLNDVAFKINTLDEAISDVITSDTALISPSGSKFELSVQDDGTLVALPIIPSKGAMFGNSLIGGSGFGMAASDNKHDYFYLITEAIKTLNPSYTSTRLTASQTGSFEALTSEGEIDAAVKKMTDALTGDENLVSIQLGDNVNTPEKNAVFPKSSLALCKAMRAKCPKARIVWMGMWYGSTEKYKAIQNACSQTGCRFISFQDLLGSEANSKIGNVQNLDSSAQRTVSNVTDVTENSNSDGVKNITVTFTVSSASYKSTLDVTEYSLQEGTLNYTSNYGIITSGGVASHPGNEGFRRISNKFLKEMKLTDENEYYSEEKGNWENTQYFIE